MHLSMRWSNHLSDFLFACLLSCIMKYIDGSSRCHADAILFPKNAPCTFLRLCYSTSNLQKDTFCDLHRLYKCYTVKHVSLGLLVLWCRISTVLFLRCCHKLLHEIATINLSNSNTCSAIKLKLHLSIGLVGASDNSFDH